MAHPWRDVLPGSFDKTDGTDSVELALDLRFYASTDTASNGFGRNPEGSVARCVKGSSNTMGRVLLYSCALDRKSVV